MYYVCYIIFSLVFLPRVISISVWDAYHSEDHRLRRLGMLNTRFQPLLHLRGEDDYRTLQNQEWRFKDEDIDENGVFLPRTSWNNRAFRNPGKIRSGSSLITQKMLPVCCSFVMASDATPVYCAYAPAPNVFYSTEAPMTQAYVPYQVVQQPQMFVPVMEQQPQPYLIPALDVTLMHQPLLVPMTPNTQMAPVMYQPSPQMIPFSPVMSQQPFMTVPFTPQPHPDFPSFIPHPPFPNSGFVADPPAQELVPPFLPFTHPSPALIEPVPAPSSIYFSGSEESYYPLSSPSSVETDCAFFTPDFPSPTTESYYTQDEAFLASPSSSYPSSSDSKHYYEMGGCIYYSYPSSSSPLTSSSSDSGEYSDVDDVITSTPLWEAEQLSIIDQLLQPCATPSFLRRFRPEGERDTQVPVLDDEEVNSLLLFALTQQKGEEEPSDEEIDEFVTSELIVAFSFFSFIGISL